MLGFISTYKCGGFTICFNLHVISGFTQDYLDVLKDLALHLFFLQTDFNIGLIFLYSWILLDQILGKLTTHTTYNWRFLDFHFLEMLECNLQTSERIKSYKICPLIENWFQYIHIFPLL